MPLHIEDVLGSALPVDHSRQVDIDHYLDPALADLPPASLVVDVGCGAGELVRKVSAAWPGLRCVGVDIADSPEVRARAAMDERFLTYDGVSLPFDTGTVGLIFSRQVLEHVQQPAALLTDIGRVLRPGGLFIGSTSQLEPFHSYSTWNYTPYGLSLLARQAGLNVLEYRPGVDAFTLIGRRLFRSRGQFDRWIAGESPFNRLIEVAGRLRRWNAQRRNAIKLQLAGHFCFLLQKPG